MNYCVSLDISADRKSNKLSSLRICEGKEDSRLSLPFLKKGQLISGTVVDVGEQVIIDFGGQNLSASRDVIKDAVVGETKIFEVLMSSQNEIELRLIESNKNTFQKIMKAVTVKEPDWKNIYDRKDQEAKQSDKEKEIQEKKNKLENISTRFTARDCQLLEEEGFSMEDFSIDGLLKVTGRMKGSSRKNLDKENSDSLGRNEIADRLATENLPVTEENITKIVNALEISKSAARLDDKALRYLISQGAEPTIENIYKACFSVYTMIPQSFTGISPETWNELRPQAEAVLTSAGYEINDKNLQDAKWLLDNNLPLTRETVAYKKSLELVPHNTKQEQVLDRVIEGIKDGTDPMEVSLAERQGRAPEQVLQDIHSIADDAVRYAVRNNLDLTVKNLADISEKGSSNPDEEAKEMEQSIASVATSLEEIKAHRQLEEIRLKMTLEAAAELEKKGFSIETQQLEKVVEALKELEDSYYQERLGEADVEGSALQIQSLKETTQSLDLLKTMPCAVLGSTLKSRFNQTIPGLIAEGSRLQAEYIKAGTAYEALMTAPNSEYGDSIQKAFSNAGMLLSELNLDNTEQNQRAVRILGYNQMEITREAIENVKAYDAEITSLIKNLHPAVTVRLIKEGQNPLNMPIYELNDRIDEIKEQQGITSEDKFSTFLRNLEKENSLTEEERKAYIGIYRLLYNVERSDGAVVGAALNTFGEVTLSHLLTAVMTRQRGKVDAVIDEEFGVLEELNRKKESISEQLAAFYEGESLEQEQEIVQEKEQNRYLKRMINQMKEELTPGKLQEAGQRLIQSGAGSRQTLYEPAVSQTSADNGIWNTIKDVPVEQLMEQLQKTEAAREYDDDMYEAKVRELRNLSGNSEQALRFLKDFQVSATPMNMMIANHILSNGTSPVTKLLRRLEENMTETSENGLKDLDELSDKLIDRSSMNEAYEKLEEDAKELLQQACSEEKIDSQKLAELKSIGQQISFLKTLSKREFYQIPIETDQGIATMNLTVIRGSGTTGKLSVTVSSETLGNMKAEISLKEQVAKGFISCDSRSGLERLQTVAGEMERTAQESGVTLKQLEYVIRKADTDNYSYQNPVSGEQSAESDPDTERILYRLAKEIVHMVQLAEKETA